MNGSYEIPAVVDQIRQRSLTIGVVALAACLVGLFFNAGQFFRSYLFAYVFWAGVALGCLTIALLHNLTGGGWGAVIRRILESGAATLPLIAVLFIPIVLFGMHHLYEWSHKEAVDASEILQHKSAYLNVPFFALRAVIYFVCWIGLAFLLRRWARKQDEEGDSPKLSDRMQATGGFGLLLYGLTMTYASIDWMMSLNPEFASTIYGLLVIAGQVLSAFAFVVAVAAILVQYKPLSGVMRPLHFHDLGKLMLAFVMIWAYLSISQFLIVWSGNLPEEIPWYIHRLNRGWQYVGLLLILFHFALPFLLLLSRSNKQKTGTLTTIALLVIVMRLVDLFWLVAPDLHHQEFHVSYMDLLMPVAIGGIWLSFFFRILTMRPLIPVNNPDLQEALEHGH